MYKIGYDQQSLNLFIFFNNGSVYRYSSVPYSIYINLLNANSIGSFFKKNIANKYKYEKI